MAKKKLILVTSPPACGKTFITKNLARALNNCVYLDKDDLIILSKQIYKVAGEPFDRSSKFFQENIRDAEYLAILEIAFNALNYNDTVLINAPFKTEIRDQEWLILANTLYGTSIRFSAGDGCAGKLIESLQKGVDEATLIKLLDGCEAPGADFSNLLRRCMVE